MFRAEAGEVSPASDPLVGHVPWSASLTTSLVAGAIWTGADVARAGGDAGSVAALVALFGSASLGLGTVVVLVGRLRPFADGVRAVLLAAVASAAPLAGAGAVLERTTHHRALGGMTFAVFALAVLLFTTGVGLRLIAVARSESRGRASAARLALSIVPVVSALGVLAVLAPTLRAGSPLRPWALDLVTGGVVLATALRFARSPRVRFGRAAVVAWLVVVVAGGAVAVASARVRTALTEGAPVAFASFSLFGG